MTRPEKRIVTVKERIDTVTVMCGDAANNPELVMRRVFLHEVREIVCALSSELAEHTRTLDGIGLTNAAAEDARLKWLASRKELEVVTAERDRLHTALRTMVDKTAWGCEAWKKANGWYEASLALESGGKDAL